MSISDRSHELIQKYFDALASEAELAELQALLAADPEVAVTFAEAARLEASLRSFFQKQYKLDQVAALLNAPETSPAPTTKNETPNTKHLLNTDDPAQLESPVASPVPMRSRFVPRYRFRGLLNAGRRGNGSNGHSWRWTWIATAALLLLATGIGIWTFRGAGDDRLQLVSGRLSVAGREVTAISENALFEVIGHEAAFVKLPGGAHIELVTGTRATIGRDANRPVVRLESGGGQFRVRAGQSAVRVETALGVITSADGQFTLDLVTKRPEQVSPTEAMRLPRLVVTVVQGSLTFERAGTSTVISAGEERVFFNSI